jgi:CheY-like chemotaxis protein
MAKILIVDDERALADSLKAILDDAGYQSAIAFSGEEALSLAPSFAPDFLLSDVCLPGIDGLTTAIRIREMLPQCLALLISGHAATMDLLRDALGQGHDLEVVPKPIHPTDLLAKIAELFASSLAPAATVLNVDDDNAHPAQ